MEHTIQFYVHAPKIIDVKKYPWEIDRKWSIWCLRTRVRPLRWGAGGTSRSIFITWYATYAVTSWHLMTTVKVWNLGSEVWSQLSSILRRQYKQSCYGARKEIVASCDQCWKAALHAEMAVISVVNGWNEQRVIDIRRIITRWPASLFCPGNETTRVVNLPSHKYSDM